MSLVLGYASKEKAIMEGWHTLTDMFSQQKWMCNPRQREEDPAIFWPWALRELEKEGQDEDIDAVIQLIRHVIIIPSSSAEAGTKLREMYRYV